MENKDLITKAIRFIQKNPKENLSLQSIADNAGFTLTYFNTVFQRHTGYSPVEYARVYKLTRSALELRRTEKTVLDIALEFGYQSPESFTRAFKKFYGMTPSDYRAKYSDSAVTWRDLSSKIALSRFGKAFPQLKPVCRETALDFLFTHDPVKYAEDIVGMTVADTAAFTLDDPDSPQSFLYVSDYNDAEPAVVLVCVDESAAVRYLKLLAAQEQNKFTIRLDIGTEWDAFDASVAKQGLICKKTFDMVYDKDRNGIPGVNGDIRELTKDDLPLLRQFKERGGCSENHVRAIQIAFEGKGDTGLRPVGLLKNGELIALAMPTLDVVRDSRKYDIGAIFVSDKRIEAEYGESIWNYVIAMCIEDHALIGNAGTMDDDSLLGVEMCEKVGLVKVAECKMYQPHP